MLAHQGFERAGADKSCAVAAVTLDLGAQDEALRQVCRASFDQWITEMAAPLPCGPTVLPRRVPWRGVCSSSPSGGSLASVIAQARAPHRL